MLKVFAFIFLGCQILWAKPQPLFHRGLETFQMVNDKSQTPVFRLLDDTVTKQSLAMALNSTYKLSKPGHPVNPYVEVRFEKMFLEPMKGQPEQIKVQVQLSGRIVDVGQTVKRKELLSGKPIRIQLPKDNEEFEMFTLNSQGYFTLQYQKPKDLILIRQAFARLDIETPLGNTETETLQFNGRGLRQIKPIK